MRAPLERLLLRRSIRAALLLPGEPVTPSTSLWGRAPMPLVLRLDAPSSGCGPRGGLVPPRKISKRRWTRRSALARDVRGELAAGDRELVHLVGTVGEAQR